MQRGQWLRSASNLCAMRRRKREQPVSNDGGTAQFRSGIRPAKVAAIGNRGRASAGTSDFRCAAA